ncbi:VTT domain-containing protein [Rubripirellula sp.]|nr:VTT domain-containing protein [Rubripirellula sp.]MDB4634505.1 VTT domain-containing protein [Rubripirellula sp.]
MRELFRTLPLMCVVLLVPIVPFLFLGGQLNDWLRGLTENPPEPVTTFALIVGLLATDILLPIPSSVISTLSGWQLGWFWGTLATWLGMNLGAMIGFALARRYGRTFALYFSRGQDLERIRKVSDQYGPLVLVLTRAMPVFAEASVLMAGIHQLAWRRFMPAIIGSNLGIAIAYAAFGDYAERHQWLPLALTVSIAVPIVVAGLARRWLPEGTKEPVEGSCEIEQY